MNPCNDIEQEVGHVEAYEGDPICFSRITPDDTGLRPYQAEIKHAVYSRWDYMESVMLQMPTGTGKTIVFTSIVRDIYRWCSYHSPEAKILIVAHRKELIEQASGKLKAIPHGIILSGEITDITLPVQVASIQTFMSRSNYKTMSKYNFAFIIIDEAHHSLATSYQKLWLMFPKSKKLGVTATPWRMSHSGFTELYDDIVLSKNIEWFITNGYLSTYDYVSIRRDSEVQQQIDGITELGTDGDYSESALSAMFDVPKIRAKLYESYEKFAKGRKGIIYAIDRKHAANICNLYSSRGVKIRLIDGTTAAKEREKVIADFRRGDVEVIVNVNIFSEGFDCPDVEFIQLARPTRSLAMYLQQIGRGLRVSRNKSISIILDNVGLYNRFGTPMAERHWYKHFIGSTEGDRDCYNDGTSVLREIILDLSEDDYPEDDEEMSVIEHAEGGRQKRSGRAESAAALKDYNVFRQNGLYGVCDRRNRVLIPPVYEDMHPYCNGYIPFKQGGKWGIMLRDGKVKVLPKYFYIGPFKNGRAEVRNTEVSGKYYINNRLERIVE